MEKKGDISLSNLSLKDIGKNANFFPVLYLVVIFCLFLVVVKIGIGKVSAQKQQINEVKKRESVLLEKKQELEKAQDQIIPLFSPSVETGLPRRNSTLVSLAQIKSLLSVFLLPIDGLSISIGNSAEGEMGQTIFRLSVIGDKKQIEAFLKEVESSSPLMTVSSVNLSEEGGMTTADIQIVSLWSSYEAKPPAPTDPLVKITDAEKEALVKLGNLKTPSFSSVSPSGPYSRTNPFVQ